MSQALTVFNKANMPARLADMFGDETNIRERQSTPTLSYEGKVWQIVLNGERTKIMRRTAEGDEEPTQVMRVVVLGVAERRGRALYEGAYDPTKISAPLCWSDDGVTPDKSVDEPKSARCETCPLSVKGSKVTEQGRAISACSSHLMVAVVPHNQLDFTPLRLKLAITSVWDNQSPDWAKQNWYAFDNYRDYLRGGGVTHTAMVVTKMRFDPNVPYPKVLFSPDRWLEPHEAAEVKPLLKSTAVTSLLGGAWTPAGADGVPVSKAPVIEVPTAKAAPTLEDDDETPAPPVKKPARAEKTAKAKAPVLDDDDGVMVLPPPTTAKAKAPALDDDDEVAVAPKPKPAVKVTTEVSEDLDDLLKGWDEDE